MDPFEVKYQYDGGFVEAAGDVTDRNTRPGASPLANKADRPGATPVSLSVSADVSNRNDRPGSSPLANKADRPGSSPLANKADRPGASQNSSDSTTSGSSDNATDTTTSTPTYLNEPSNQTAPTVGATIASPIGKWLLVGGAVLAIGIIAIVALKHKSPDTEAQIK